MKRFVRKIAENKYLVRDGIAHDPMAPTKEAQTLEARLDACNLVNQSNLIQGRSVEFCNLLPFFVRRVSGSTLMFEPEQQSFWTLNVS